MKKFLKITLLTTTLLVPSLGLYSAVSYAQSDDGAEEATIDAQETHDAEAISQLELLVTTAQTTLSDIGKLITSALERNTLLTEMRDSNAVIQSEVTQTKTLQAQQVNAVTGPKVIPEGSTFEGAADSTENLSIFELARSAGNNGDLGPPLIANGIGAYRELFALESIFDAGKENSAKVTEAIGAAFGAAGGGIAEASFASTTESAARLEGYMTSLSSSPDLKTSIDLNTRVLLELVQQTNESIKSESAATILISSYMMLNGKSVLSGRGFSFGERYNR